LKKVEWISSSKKDLLKLPDKIQQVFGYSLYQAQMGDKPFNAKPLKGFLGAGVLEILEDDKGGTYRAVYTVKFEDVIYVLHIFQKKSKHGIETPKEDIDLIKSRLKIAQEIHNNRVKK